MWKAAEAYNQLQAPPSQDLETARVLKGTIEARSALAALNQALRTLPNPAILIGTLPLLEAQASSQIENIVTTTDDLFRDAAHQGQGGTPETKETLRYRSALYTGVKLLRTRPLGVTVAMAVASKTRGVETPIRQLPGTHIGDPRTGHVIYTPPDGKDVIEAKMRTWEQFLHHSDGLDPLVTMAAAHYYFEAIHPFADGNGRAGRILNVLFLMQAGLLDQPVLYLSRYLIRNRSEYYRRLLNVTAKQDWESWLLFMLRAVEQTSRETLETITQVQALQENFRDQMRTVSASGANVDLLQAIFEQPYTRISTVMEACSVSRPTATKWLRQLRDQGLLTEITEGREKLFVNRPLLAILRGDQPE